MYISGLRNRAGYIIITDPAGPTIEQDTYQCCHCNAHFEREVGKGPPGMCLMCMQPICGKKCVRCIPFEAKLEAWEGRRRFWKDIDLSAGR